MKLPRIGLLVGVAAFGMAHSAAAQMDHSNMPGMNMPGMKMPPAKRAPAKRAPAAKRASPARKPPASSSRTARTPAPKPSATRRAPARSAPSAAATRPPAAHDMANMPGMPMPADHNMANMPGMQTSPQPAAQGQRQSGQPIANMPGMEMPADHNMANMPGMQMPTSQPMRAVSSGTDLAAGNAPPPPVPADFAADTVYGPSAMAMGRHHLFEFHGNQKLFQALVNIAEYQVRDGRDGYRWDAEAWYGGDLNRLWLKSEGDGEIGRELERTEVQALYSRAIDPYFNLQGGIRYDIEPRSRAYATIGVEGLAPSFFDVEAALFLSTKGELMARTEGWYDQRITQRLIVQPRVEVNFAAQDSADLRVGSGLSDAEVGVRLRYDIRREFAPYVGVQYEQAFGRTRRYLEAAGQDAGGWSFLAGLRTWF